MPDLSRAPASRLTADTLLDREHTSRYKTSRWLDRNNSTATKLLARRFGFSPAKVLRRHLLRISCASWALVGRVCTILLVTSVRCFSAHCRCTSLRASIPSRPNSKGLVGRYL